MIIHTITVFEPESRSQCDDTDCEDCHIMQQTLIGANLPRCFNYEKSESYLGMSA